MKPIIIDTDMCSDCDDVGALVLANRLMERGEAQILAVTGSTEPETSILCAAAVNAQYGHRFIPLGKTSSKCKAAAFCQTNCFQYTKEVVDTFFEGNEPFYKSAVEVYREILAGLHEKITIVTIGPLTNIADLISSPPDDYSRLNGMELIEAKVERFVMMAGCFDGSMGDSFTEWNIKVDIEAARKAIASIPVPITFCGFEIGEKVLSGNSFAKCSARHPAKIAYSLYGASNGRSSWDPISVLYAVRGSKGLWREKSGVTVQVSEDGVTTYLENGGKHTILQPLADTETVAYTLNQLMEG